MKPHVRAFTIGVSGLLSLVLLLLVVNSLTRTSPAPSRSLLGQGVLGDPNPCGVGQECSSSASSLVPSSLSSSVASSVASSTASSAAAVCGNGVEESGEECDDGDADNTDECTSTCMDAECGDGYVRVGVEACDGGLNCISPGQFNSCQIPQFNTGGEPPLPSSSSSSAASAGANISSTSSLSGGIPPGGPGGAGAAGGAGGGQSDTYVLICNTWTGQLNPTPILFENALSIANEDGDQFYEFDPNGDGYISQNEEGGLVFFLVDPADPTPTNALATELCLPVRAFTVYYEDGAFDDGVFEEEDIRCLDQDPFTSQDEIAEDGCWYPDEVGNNVPRCVNILESPDLACAGQGVRRRCLPRCGVASPS